jgi:hypothetical protein
MQCPFRLEKRGSSDAYDQVICSGNECQRRRRTEYHRQKLKDDPLYHAQCRDSQQQWREQHPEYMPNYRGKHGRPSAKTPTLQSPRDLIRLLESVKNNVAFDLTAVGARIWLVSSDGRVKNILATTELILVQALPGDE